MGGNIIVFPAAMLPKLALRAHWLQAPRRTQNIHE